MTFFVFSRILLHVLRPINSVYYANCNHHLNKFTWAFLIVFTLLIFYCYFLGIFWPSAPNLSIGTSGSACHTTSPPWQACSKRAGGCGSRALILVRGTIRGTTPCTRRRTEATRSFARGSRTTSAWTRVASSRTPAARQLLTWLGRRAMRSW